MLYRIILTLIICFSLKAEAQQLRPAGTKKTSITPGAYHFQQYLPYLQEKKVALFVNQTSKVGSSHLVDTLLKQNINVVKIFAPEHGFRGDADAGEHVSDSKDPKTGLPIISLYGAHKKPTAEDLKDVDVLVYDVQDVGLRFYTYISSLEYLMEAAMEEGKLLMVLDRPNPLGNIVDGPVLEPSFKSFVGMQPIPVIYGMTPGEYGDMLIGEEWVKSKLRKADFEYVVIPCQNYTHFMLYDLPVAPSPNLPNMQSIWLYAGLCFFEGTVVSLGRGTDKPFQQFGHPKFPSTGYSFTPRSVAGAKNPPLLNETCNGYDLSAIDARKEVNNQLQLKWLLKAYEMYPNKEEFFLKNNFFNKLAGNSSLMEQIKTGKSEAMIRASWEPSLSNFKAIRKKYLLYRD